MFLITVFDSFIIVSVAKWIKQSTNNTEVMGLIPREHIDF